MAKARTIRETDVVERDHDAADQRYPRFGELWDGWTWRIARGPDLAYSVPGFPNFYVCKSHGSWAKYGVPVTTFVYQILDDDTVEITALLVP